MKRYAAIALVAVAFLAGCGSEATIDENGNRVNFQGTEEFVTQYQGKPIHCLGNGQQYKGWGSCDFVRWHQENDTP